MARYYFESRNRQCNERHGHSIDFIDAAHLKQRMRVMLVQQLKGVERHLDECQLPVIVSLTRIIHTALLNLWGISGGMCSHLLRRLQE